MSDTAPPPAPRAIRLDAGGEAKAAHVTVAPETSAPDAPPATPKPARRRWRWGVALASALGSLALIGVTFWVEDMVVTALRRSDVLGPVALAAAVVLAVAALVLVIRAIRDAWRERRMERLKKDAAAAVEARSGDAARAVAERLVAMQKNRPETAAGRARFAAALPGLTDSRDIIALAERELVEPLDAVVTAEIARAARQVSMVTAVSPRALIDLVFVVFAGGRLLAAVARAYGHNPGPLGLWRIGRASLEHLLVTGGLAAGDAVLSQLMGQGLAARLSAKLGEGVLNGLMTARLGLAAMTVCRPLPFVEARAPTLGDVAAGLLGSRDDRKDQG
jgi:putative membrane protein